MRPSLTLIAVGIVGLSISMSAVGQTIRYYHTDINGSVVAVSDEEGNIIERRAYEPYGLPRTPVDDGPGYTGHVHDSETGLIYAQQRYYDPEVGRFLSVDPMAVDTTTAWNFNRYIYAANNPYRFRDPDGREAVCIFAPTECGLRELTPEMRDAQLTLGLGIMVAAGSLAMIWAPDPTDLVLAQLASRSLGPVSRAYKVATAGGKHAGFLRQQVNKSAPELRRTISSYEKRIEDHQRKIQNPEQHMTRDSITPESVERAQRDWSKEIETFKEQRDIARDVLRQQTCTGSRIPGNC